MKRILVILIFLKFCIVSNGQVDCSDYRIVSIYDMPPSPLAPGGNYFLLLLTLEKDYPNNWEIYADLTFVDNIADTISIPTGPNQTLPRLASDTIPYLLELNTLNANQDFPHDFNGKLVIRHSTLQICEIGFTNTISAVDIINSNFNINVYPNPFVDYIKVDSEVPIELITVFGANGTKLKSLNLNRKSCTINLSELDMGIYFLSIKRILEKPKLIKVLKR